VGVDEDGFAGDLVDFSLGDGLLRMAEGGKCKGKEKGGTQRAQRLRRVRGGRQAGS
jgi:hypothetical protein